MTALRRGEHAGGGVSQSFACPGNLPSDFTGSDIQSVMGSAALFLIIGYDQKILMNDRRNAKAMSTGYATQVFFPKKLSLVIVCGSPQFRSVPPYRVDPLVVQCRCAGGKAIIAVSLMGFGSIGTGPFDFSASGVHAENGTGFPLSAEVLRKTRFPHTAGLP